MAMTMEMFCSTIKNDIQKELGDGFRTRIMPTMKNNDTRLTGLVITEKECGIAPTIYLDPYYDEYINSRLSLKEIRSSILECYRSSRSQGNSFDLSGFGKWENVKPKLACKLVNYNANRELLETTPHERFLDLAVVCYYMVDIYCSATILIQNKFLTLWGTAKNELIQTAKENTFRLLTPRIKKIEHILMGLADDMAEPADCMEPCGLDKRADLGMYVLSNHAFVYGSICILYPDLLKNFAGKIQDDLYIIPSSIHEVLLVPAGGTPGDSETLSELVRDVNRTQVEREETLSDHVYYYSRETDRITM